MLPPLLTRLRDFPSAHLWWYQLKICSIKIPFLCPTIESLFFTAACKNSLVKQPGLTTSFWKCWFLRLLTLAPNLVFGVWVLIQPQLHHRSLRSGDMRITCTERATLQECFHHMLTDGLLCKDQATHQTWEEIHGSSAGSFLKGSICFDSHFHDGRVGTATGWGGWAYCVHSWEAETLNAGD